MTKKVLFFLFILNFIFSTVKSENAPITKVISVLNATTVSGSTNVPITVTNFQNIGAFTLTLSYQTSAITFVSASCNAAFSGITINTSTPGKIIFAWTGSNGVTLPDQTHLFDIKFTYISGTSSLNWTTTNSSCIYKKYAGGLYTVLTDSPKTSYYINGAITNHPAPITYAPKKTSVSNGNITVPISVKNFSNVGAVTLKLIYNPNILSYQTFIPNAQLTSLQVGTSSGGTGEQILTIQWYGSSSVTLADSAVLVSLNFSYFNISGNGNYSELTWSDNGPSCEYTDALGNVLYDSPTSDFYKNGLIASQLSPYTWIPNTSNAVSGNYISVPVLVNNFTNITGLKLTLKYNPSVLTLPQGNYVPNSTFGSTLTLTDNLTADGYRTIVISWNGTSKSLSNGSSIVTMNFLYNSSTSLIRIASSGDSCNYKDANANYLWKAPVSSYYQSGFVASHLAPVTKVATVTGAKNQTVTAPVTVTRFANIGSISLILNYDPGMLTYQSATLVPAMGGTFSATNSELGKLTLQWSGNGYSLSDNSTLFNITFNCIGGTSILQWYNSSCSYSEGSTALVLYDQPKSTYYLNGSVIPAPVLNAKVFLEGPYSSGSMTTTLRDNGLLPLAQPYSASPCNYQGAEQVSSIPASVTDWVLVELRTSTAASSRVAIRACFIRNDGRITDIDGNGNPGFSNVNNGDYYVVIHHRNHLPIMSSKVISLNTASSLHDFSIGSNMVYGGSTGYKIIDAASLTWGMIAGDASNDGNIYINDYTDYWVPAFGLSNVYSIGDFNMDGRIYINDYTDFWVPNFGKSNILP